MGDLKLSLNLPIYSDPHAEGNHATFPILSICLSSSPIHAGFERFRMFIMSYQVNRKIKAWGENTSI